MPGGIIRGQVMVLFLRGGLICSPPLGTVHMGTGGQRAGEQRQLYVCEFHFLSFENKVPGMGSYSVKMDSQAHLMLSL